MKVELEDDLELVKTRPDCIQITLFANGQGGFTVADDDRGQASLFKYLETPAVFVEAIHTFAGKIRGNHVHQGCAEIMHVISGEIELYLLCKHGKHVFMQAMEKGEAIITPAGTPHALYSTQDSECIVLFDKDPSNDRARVPILRF